MELDQIHFEALTLPQPLPDNKHPRFGDTALVNAPAESSPYRAIAGMPPALFTSRSVDLR